MRTSRGSSAARWAPSAPASTTASSRCAASLKGKTPMSDKDIGKALLQLDAANLANVADVREQVARVLQRDQKRVKLWTLLTAALWLLPVSMVIGILIFLGFLFPMCAQ